MRDRINISPPPKKQAKHRKHPMKTTKRNKEKKTHPFNVEIEKRRAYNTSNKQRNEEKKQTKQSKNRKKEKRNKKKRIRSM